jgi:hypothetical protein
MKKIEYKQCGLKNGDRYLNTWLPEKFAVKGKFVKLKQADGSWWDGWEVNTVSDVSKPIQDISKNVKFGSIQK